MLKFRNAETADSVRLTEIALASKQHWGYCNEFMVACREELNQSQQKIKDPQFLFRVVEENSEIVAFFCLEKITRLEAEVEALFISPEFIGRGVGRACWDELLKVARECCFAKLRIASDPYALPFYLKMGARQTGEIPSQSIKGRSLPLLQYTLSV